MKPASVLLRNSFAALPKDNAVTTLERGLRNNVHRVMHLAFSVAHLLLSHSGRINCEPHLAFHCIQIDCSAAAGFKIAVE